MITNEQAAKLNTNRLLKYFKSIRRFGNIHEFGGKIYHYKDVEYEEHFAFVKQLLSDREHVKK